MGAGNQAGLYLKNLPSVDQLELVESKDNSLNTYASPGRKRSELFNFDTFKKDSNNDVTNGYSNGSRNNGQASKSASKDLGPDLIAYQSTDNGKGYRATFSSTSRVISDDPTPQKPKKITARVKPAPVKVAPVPKPVKISPTPVELSPTRVEVSTAPLKMK